jgi:hypothetical protein
MASMLIVGVYCVKKCDKTPVDSNGPGAALVFAHPIKERESLDQSRNVGMWQGFSRGLGIDQG